MTYYVNVQKIGSKSMRIAYNRVHTHYAYDGMVCMGYYDNDKPVGVTRTQPILVPVEQRLQEIVTGYINSGAYSRITVTIPKDHGHAEKVYEWRMDSEKVQVQGMGYAEYQRKRKALKAQIKALEAQVAALDEEWYRGC